MEKIYFDVDTTDEYVYGDAYVEIHSFSDQKSEDILKDIDKFEPEVRIMDKVRPQFIRPQCFESKSKKEFLSNLVWRKEMYPGFSSDDLTKAYKRSVLGQLAFGTERFILEHIYGVPLSREKSRYKLKDFDEDNLDQTQKQKWDKIKQNILDFDDFVDTSNFLKNGRLDSAHPDKNLDQTE
eukprot:gene10552-3071_t